LKTLGRQEVIRPKSWIDWSYGQNLENKGVAVSGVRLAVCMAGQNLRKMRQCGTNDAYGAEKSIKGQQKLQNIAQNKWLRAKTILCVVFLINIFV
jgi:hypothetical protein